MTMTCAVLSRPRRELLVRDLHTLKTFAGEDVFHVVVVPTSKCDNCGTQTFGPMRTALGMRRHFGIFYGVAGAHEVA
jgi:hypothetical protein